MLRDGHYKTDHGSEMWVAKNGGRSRVLFDWFEEEACCDCNVDPYPDGDGCMTWSCDICGGGRARLFPVSSLQDQGVQDAMKLKQRRCS